MNEKLVVLGEYRHVEGLSYRVLGMATRGDGVAVGKTVGVALAVAGYEETGQVSGERIQVFRSVPIKKGEEDKMPLFFSEMDSFSAPGTVVVYEQLDQGEKYPARQLWWRPAENFLQHFTLIEK